ncbi:hypothetical protein FNH04_41530, partial [Streptomyces phyllanthi]
MRTALVQATGALTRFRTALTQASSAGNQLRTAAGQSSAEVQKLKTSAQQAATGVQTAARNAATGGGLFGRLTGGLRGATTAMRGLNTAMKANIMGAIISIVMLLVTKIVDMAMQSKTVQAVMQRVFKAVGDVISRTMNFVRPIIERYWPRISEVIMKAVNLIWTGVKTYFTLLWTFWKTVFDAVVAIVRFGINMVVSYIQGVKRVYTIVRDAFTQAKNAVSDRISSVIGFVKELPGKITSQLSGLAGRLKTMGGDIIQGLINGIRDKAGALVSTVRNFVIDKIPGPIRSALGISSPSKLMMGFGRDVGEGLALGIEGTGNRVSGAAGRLATATARSAIGPGYSLAGTAARSALRPGGATTAPVTVNVHP